MKVTEKEAIMLYNDWRDDKGKYDLEHWVKMFQDHGYIKKSKLEKAREYSKSTCYCVNVGDADCLPCIQANMWEEAIKEIQGLGQAE